MRVEALRWGLCLAGFFLGLCGCDAGQEPGAVATRSPAASSPALASPRAEQPVTPSGAKAAAAANEKVPPSVPRKIIYNAQLTLYVQSVPRLADEINRLVAESGGYVAEKNFLTSAQQFQKATWRIRVPVEQFPTFVAAVGRLGDVQQNHIDSQDVTQEYYDLEARIKNKQIEEKRLQKHLDDSTGKLEDILAVEREITRVRGEVEQMEGRIRYLANMTALSTVTITAHEEPRPGPPPHAETFAEAIGRTFHSSLEQLTNFAKTIVLVSVALAPWLPLVVLLSLLAWLVRMRRAVRRNRPA